MSTVGLEAELVSDVVDGVDNTVRAGVRVLAADLNSLVLSADVFELTLFLGRLAIAGLITKTEASNSDVVNILSDDDCVPGVFNWNGDGRGDEKSEDNEGFHFWSFEVGVCSCRREEEVRLTAASPSSHVSRTLKVK